MLERTRTLIDDVSEKHDRWGTGGVARMAFNRLLVRWGSVEIVHFLLLERGRMRVPDMDGCFETRFLTPEEVGRFAATPAYRLSRDFADRASAGLDLCFGAIHGDRLASYGWYALHSVEPEHAAGSALALPPDIAYMYKGFTHPDYRGCRLYGACMGRALQILEGHGLDRLVAFVHWSNAASLRSCKDLGYRSLGLLAVGPGGPVRVPREARRLGVRFGGEAAPALRSRRQLLEALSAHDA
jgi:hypothetical protein